VSDRAETESVGHDYYQQRCIHPLGIWSFGSWRFKVYQIKLSSSNNLEQDVLAAARAVIPDVIAKYADCSNNYNAGFIGLHRGRRGLFLFVDWWADEKELHQRCFYTDQGCICLQPTSYEDPIGCVWDLKLIAFEAECWVRHFLAQSHSVDAYLADFYAG